MKRDWYFPAALAIALAVMAVYAVTGSDDGNSSELDVVPVACKASGGLSTLAPLPEASGLAMSRRDPRLLWAHNDSGEPTIYGVGTDGEVRGRVRVAGASTVDWEAITTAPCADGSCLYVGDIGDNGTDRKAITVYRTTEPSVSDAATGSVMAFEGVYPEGAQDAEAMFVANGSLYVVTKGEKSPIRIYRFPALETEKPLTLHLVTTLTTDGAEKIDRVTDAAVSPDGTWVVLRTTDRLLFYKAAALLSGKAGTPLGFDLRGLKEPQGEGVAWEDGNTILLAGEAAGGGTFARVSCTLP